MESNKRNSLKRILTRAIAMLLVAVFAALDVCSVPVLAETGGSTAGEALMQLESPLDRGGMQPIDLSQEGVDAARVSEEELVQHFNLEQVDIETAEAEFAAECATMQPKDREPESEAGVSGNSVSGNGVSDNSIAMNQTAVSQEQAVYATAEDAAEYLCDKMVQRKDYITVKVTAVSNTQKLAVNQYARQILNEAVAYNINGDPDEGDYLYWHLSYMEWAGRESGNGTYTIQFGIEYRSTAGEEKYVTKKVDSIIKKLNLKSSSLNQYEKVRLIYDYIMDCVEYDYYHYENDQSYNYMYTTYGALSDGSAVCQAYATLFYRLCEEIGISSRVIAGNNDSNNVPTHGWNIVKIGSCYYNVDATWDDSDNPTHIYFLKTKAEFYDHTRDGEYATSAFNKAFPMAKVSYRLPEMENSVLSMNAANITGTITLTDGSSYSFAAAGKPKVILFIDGTENGSVAMVEYFYDIAKLLNGSCEGAIIDICNSYDSAEQPAQLMDIIQSMTDFPSAYKYSSAYEAGLGYKNKYAALAGKAPGNASAVVVIGGANKVRYYGEGVNAVASVESILETITNVPKNGTISSLKVSQTKNNEAKLSWKAFSGAKQYLVYRKQGKGSYYCVGSTTKTSYLDEVSAKKSYTYQVYAYSGKTQVARSGEKTLKTKQILPKKGKTFTVDGNKYKVLTSTSKSKTVSFRGVTNKNATYVEIPSTVKIHGISYKVTEIASNALKNKKKVKTVVIGGNVTKIGSKAFYGAKKLVNIVIESKKLTKVGSNALKGISSKAQIRVPSSRYSRYKKLLKSKGQGKSVKIKK